MEMNRKVYVLETNLFFEDENNVLEQTKKFVSKVINDADIAIPKKTIEELDYKKKDSFEEVQLGIRYINQIQKMDEVSIIDADLKLLPVEYQRRTGDNLILSSILKLKHDNPKKDIIFISNDINIRTKASSLEINSFSLFEILKQICPDEISKPNGEKIIVSSTENTGCNSIKRALEIVKEGGEIIIKKGVYREFVEINKNVTIRGESENPSGFPVIWSEPDRIVLSINSCCIIKNLSFVSTFNIKAVEPEMPKGVELYPCAFINENAVLENIYIQSKYSTGLVISDFSPKFTNCAIYNCKNNGINICGEKSNPIFNKCKIEKSKGIGVFGFEQAHGTFNSCIIKDNNKNIMTENESAFVFNECKVN